MQPLYVCTSAPVCVGVQARVCVWVRKPEVNLGYHHSSGALTGTWGSPLGEADWPASLRNLLVSASPAAGLQHTPACLTFYGLGDCSTVHSRHFTSWAVSQPTNQTSSRAGFWNFFSTYDLFLPENFLQDPGSIGILNRYINQTFTDNKSLGSLFEARRW